MRTFLSLLFLIGLVSTPALALKTVTAVTVSPHGAVVIQGTSLTYKTSCTYSDNTADACIAENAGSATWKSYFSTCYSITPNGVATWVAGPNCDPANNAIFSSGEFTAQAYVSVCYQKVCDKAGVLAQHAGHTFYPYITPDYREFQDGDYFGNNPYPLNVAVGSRPQLGLGYVYNNNNTGSTGTPGQFTCNWASSDKSKATIDRYGAVTAIAPGNVTMTCNPGGNGLMGNSTQKGWSSANGGNGITLVVVNPKPTLRHWYVRPDGGSYYDRTNSPGNQCDGLSNLPAAGASAHHCAVSNIRNLYWNDVLGTTHIWVIGPGDIVDIAPSSPATAGYNLNSDPGGGPHNCYFGGYGCYMPPIPSGTATNHTVIRGTNYASCTSDAQKTLLNGSMGGKYVMNLTDSQYVDVQCVEISQQSQCGGIYTHACGKGTASANNGIWISALTSSVTLTDVYIYGLAATGIFGASGYNGITMNRLHIQGMPGFGINMDDGSWGSSNISVAGGLTMNDSIVEWTGCVAEHPVVHQYPYIECRDSSTNNNWSSPDGIGEGNTSGYWSFDHVIMRYNWQDDFDLLHSGMQYLSITNSQSYGSIGASFKIGPADYVQLINNQSVQNCQRMATPIGDEPPSAIVPGANYCRGNDWAGFSFAAGGTYNVLFNSFTGYQDVPFDFGCSWGYLDCSAATAIFQNNLVLGYSKRQFRSGDRPSLFYQESSKENMPSLQGWSVRDHNIYFNVRDCPTALQAGESCNANPLLTGQPASPIASETVLDNFNFMPTAASPLVGGGNKLPSVSTDSVGTPRSSFPTIGAFEIPSETKPKSRPMQNGCIACSNFISFLQAFWSSWLERTRAAIHSLLHALRTKFS
jgi:hypothetical protein